MQLEALINKHYEELNENERAILSFVLKNRTTAQTLSIVKMAEACHTSKSSILRLTQKLGFSGFSEFKYFLKKEAIVHRPAEDVFALQKKDIEMTQKLLNQVDLRTIVQKIYKAKRVFGFGTGWGQQNAVKELRRNLMGCGKHMLTIPAKTELELNMPLMTPEDLLIFISLSGDVTELRSHLQTLNMRGIPILSITSFCNNHLATKADYNLYYHATPLKQTEGSEILSFITLNIVGDALFREYVSYLDEVY